jgi:hypothetical protein
MNVYAESQKEHWLRAKCNEGGVLVLEDESRWEVSPPDRARTFRWLRISTIVVETSKQQGSPLSPEEHHRAGDSVCQFRR